MNPRNNLRELPLNTSKASVYLQFMRIQMSGHKIHQKVEPINGAHHLLERKGIKWRNQVSE